MLGALGTTPDLLFLCLLKLKPRGAASLEKGATDSRDAAYQGTQESNDRVGHRQDGTARAPWPRGFWLLVRRPGSGIDLQTRTSPVA